MVTGIKKEGKDFCSILAKASLIILRVEKETTICCHLGYFKNMKWERTWRTRVEISGNYERGFGECNTHKAAANFLISLYEWMPELRQKGMTKGIKLLRAVKVVEGHDRPCPEEIRYIKKEENADVYSWCCYKSKKRIISFVSSMRKWMELLNHS